ncbi:MAG: sensor domain-containing diguanylate cyclase [Campylobacterota bacterium]|nr:sensor domain-containing diguanylate cyclase [Campylobacterota bacterium]
MDKEITQIKQHSYFLRTNRNDIVDKWLQSEVVDGILLKNTIIVSAKDKKIFYDFFDCIISVMQWDLTISECPIKMDFLKYLNNHTVGTFDFFNLFVSLKNTISSVMYEHEIISFGLLKDLEKVSLGIANDLFNTYEQIQKNEISFSNNHSNLLNEYKKAVDLSNIVSKSNTKGIITYVNDKFCEISGYSKAELIGKPHSIVRHPSMPSTVFKDVWDTIKSKKSWNGLITNMKRDGRKYVVNTSIIPILDIDGDIVEYIAIRHDVTEFEQTKEQLSTLNMAMKNKVDELYSMTATLEEEASIDSLTGIFNRAKLDKFFTYEIEKAKVTKNILSMIILDIDHFKSINDTYGHHVGDDVLKQLAKIVEKSLKRVDIFARWGGEEFVILLPGTTLKGATLLSEKIRDLIENTRFSTAGKITASFGVGLYNNNESQTTFFKKVDKALYQAKKLGRNRVVTAK